MSRCTFITELWSGLLISKPGKCRARYDYTRLCPGQLGDRLIPPYTFYSEAGCLAFWFVVAT